MPAVAVVLAMAGSAAARLGERPDGSGSYQPSIPAARVFVYPVT